MALKALCFWRQPKPVTTVAELVGYVDTRAKFVAQTSLYSYIKTRVGTRYVSLMEDDTFVHSVNIAKWEIYLACLRDFAIYAAACVGGTVAREDELRALAIHLVDAALETEEVPAERPQGFADARDAHSAHVKSLDWRADRATEAAFQASQAALVEWAPIADELKMHDVEIVKTSMRGKWKKVREQFARLLVPEAVLADWRARSAHADGSAR